MSSPEICASACRASAVSGSSGACADWPRSRRRAPASRRADRTSRAATVIGSSDGADYMTHDATKLFTTKITKTIGGSRDVLLGEGQALASDP